MEELDKFYGFYGTLICDLERSRPIDVLPDREVKTVSAWFEKHPSVEIVSRDRSSEYAAAIRKGAPQALQVADRWHLGVRRIGACWISFRERRG
jgi:transposase